jgi:radical SAM superfamily enzyme YgiQ (UPF0313 family)
MKPSLYLIRPNIENNFLAFVESLRFVQKKASTMPLGMATMASIAEEYCRSVALCDGSFQTIDYKTTAGIVGISFYTNQKQEAFQIADRFKALGKYVILGGAHPTFFPEECRSHADSLFCGEAEYTFRQFFRDFEQGNPRPLYRQIEKVDMKDSPIPAYHLLPMNEYSSGGVNYSRGCPLQCEFCVIKEEWFNGRKVRQKSSGQILAELDELKEFKHLDNVLVHDDNFIGGMKGAKDLLKSIVSWQKGNGYPFNLTAQATLSMAKDDELLHLFHEAGFKTVYIGVETTNHESLQTIKKSQNTGKLLIQDIKRIQSHGLDVWAGIITGLDGDRKDIFEQILDFIQQSGIMVTSLGPLIVIDRTPLRERLAKEGRYKQVEFSDIYHPAFGVGKRNSKGQPIIGTINYKPLHMTEEELIVGTNWLLGQIYSHKNYSKRLKDMIRRKIKTRIMPSHSSIYPSLSLLSAFVLAPYILLFSSKESFYYNTKLVLWTMLKKPRYWKDLLYYLIIHARIFTFYKGMIGNLDSTPDDCPVAVGKW